MHKIKKTALIHYLRQINEQVTSKSFAFYILVRGRQPCIYNHWSAIVDLTINYPNPHFRRFYWFHEAIEYARKKRPNYYVSHLVKPLDRASSSSSTIQFCNYFEVMARTIRKLNNTRYYIDGEVEACRHKKVALENAIIELNR